MSWWIFARMLLGNRNRFRFEEGKGRMTTTTMKSVKSAVTPLVTCSSVSHVILGGGPLALSCDSMDFRLSLPFFSSLTPPDPLPAPSPQTLALLPCPSPSFPQLSFNFSSPFSFTTPMVLLLHLPKTSQGDGVWLTARTFRSINSMKKTGDSDLDQCWMTTGVLADALHGLYS